MSRTRIGSARGPAFFHDITLGNNALDSTLGFSAKPGYDLATGWGTPNVARIVEALASEGSDRNIEFNDPGQAAGSTTGKASHTGATMTP